MSLVPVNKQIALIPIPGNLSISLAAKVKKTSLKSFS